MTDQLEMVEIVNSAPRKYVRGWFEGRWVRVPVQAVRRICEDCGEGFWAWPDDFDWRCAKCQGREAVE